MYTLCYSSNVSMHHCLHFTDHITQHFISSILHICVLILYLCDNYWTRFLFITQHLGSRIKVCELHIQYNPTASKSSVGRRLLGFWISIFQLVLLPCVDAIMSTKTSYYCGFIFLKEIMFGWLVCVTKLTQPFRHLLCHVHVWYSMEKWKTILFFYLVFVSRDE